MTTDDAADDDDATAAAANSTGTRSIIAAAVRSSEVRTLREENEDLCERLAFVEGEAEDYRNELNAERDRHREEVEELGGDVHALATKLRMREEELESLRADPGSYIGNISVEEVVGRGGGGAATTSTTSSRRH